MRNVPVVVVRAFHYKKEKKGISKRVKSKTVVYSSFEDLDVYKAAIGFTGKIYKLLEKNPLKKDFAMVDQLRRATISISNNISEGFERETDRELIRFLYFSKGSAGEVRNLFNVMDEIDYFEKEELKEYRKEVLNISRQLANYIKFVKKRIA